MTIANWFWSVTAFLFGICIGSFLNVVIWRIPRGGSLVEPRFSYCPHCKRQLEHIDLIPLFSFLLLGRRCRRCKQPISWRYFSVELLTGVLFVALYLRFSQSPPDAVALMLFAALLVPMTFIDLEFFMIPTSLNLLAFVVAIGRDAWGIAQHEPDHVLLWGWCPRSVAGAALGTLLFGAVRVAGWIWKRQEAMGLGDIYLARAMGAFLAQLTVGAQPIYRLFPLWVLFACFSGIVVGVPLTLVRRRREEEREAEIALKRQEAARKQAQQTAKSGKMRQDQPTGAQNRTKSAGSAPESSKGNRPADVEQTVTIPEEPESSLGQEIKDVLEVLLLRDLFELLAPLFDRLTKRAARSGRSTADQTPIPTIAEEEFEPLPSAIPFGPFLALGFLATVFAGELLTAWYLAYALPKPAP